MNPFNQTTYTVRELINGGTDSYDLAIFGSKPYADEYAKFLTDTHPTDLGYVVTDNTPDQTPYIVWG